MVQRKHFLYHKLIRVFIAVFIVQKYIGTELSRSTLLKSILAGTASNTSIVRLSRRRVDTARALVHVIATDAADKSGAE